MGFCILLALMPVKGNAALAPPGQARRLRSAVRLTGGV